MALHGPCTLRFPAFKTGKGEVKKRATLMCSVLIPTDQLHERRADWHQLWHGTSASLILPWMYTKAETKLYLDAINHCRNDRSYFDTSLLMHSMKETLQLISIRRHKDEFLGKKDIGSCFVFLKKACLYSTCSTLTAHTGCHIYPHSNSPEV